MKNMGAISLFVDIGINFYCSEVPATILTFLMFWAIDEHGILGMIVAAGGCVVVDDTKGWCRMSQVWNNDTLDEVRQDIAATSTKLEQLRSVEAYILDRISRNGHYDPGAQRLTPTVMPQRMSGRFDRKMKFEAAEMLLKEAGSPLKTAEMTRLLQEAGFSAEMDPQTLSNAIFTAMTRKPETFQKVGRGVWGLVEWNN